MVFREFDNDHWENVQKYLPLEKSHRPDMYWENLEC
jgi:hypothetical protein